MSLYFPHWFETAEQKEYYNLMRKRTMATIEAIVNDEGWENVEKLTTELLAYRKPAKFEGEGNVEIATDKNFERMCIILQQHLNVDAKSLTTLAFYNAYDYLSEQNKKQLKR